MFENIGSLVTTQYFQSKGFISGQYYILKIVWKRTKEFHAFLDSEVASTTPRR